MFGKYNGFGARAEYDRGGARAEYDRDTSGTDKLRFVKARGIKVSVYRHIKFDKFWLKIQQILTEKIWKIFYDLANAIYSPCPSYGQGHRRH
jgi:hypothetical protein